MLHESAQCKSILRLTLRSLDGAKQGELLEVASGQRRLRILHLVVLHQSEAGPICYCCAHQLACKLASAVSAWYH